MSYNNEVRKIVDKIEDLAGKTVAKRARRRAMLFKDYRATDTGLADLRFERNALQFRESYVKDVYKVFDQTQKKLVSGATPEQAERYATSELDTLAKRYTRTVYNAGVKIATEALGKIEVLFRQNKRKQGIIDGLREQNKQYESQIRGLKNDIKQKDQQISDLETRVDGLQADVNNREAIKNTLHNIFSNYTP
jgi:chromosome segregation ATPase